MFDAVRKEGVKGGEGWQAPVVRDLHRFANFIIITRFPAPLACNYDYGRLLLVQPGKGSARASHFQIDADYQILGCLGNYERPARRNGGAD